MEKDATMILVYPTLFKCDFTPTILAKNGTYAHSVQPDVV